MQKRTVIDELCIAILRVQKDIGVFAEAGRRAECMLAVQERIRLYRELAEAKLVRDSRPVYHNYCQGLDMDDSFQIRLEPACVVGNGGR